MQRGYACGSCQVKVILKKAVSSSVQSIIDLVQPIRLFLCYHPVVFPDSPGCFTQPDSTSKVPTFSGCKSLALIQESSTRLTSAISWQAWISAIKRVKVALVTLSIFLQKIPLLRHRFCYPMIGAAPVLPPLGRWWFIVHPRLAPFDYIRWSQYRQILEPQEIGRAHV